MYMTMTYLRHFDVASNIFTLSDNVREVVT